MSALARLLTPRTVAAVLLAIALPLTAGCGGSRGSVSGKVTYKGQPLPYGSVVFYSTGGTFASEIQPDGSYSVSKVPTGTSKISVTCQDPKVVDFMKALSASARDPKIPPPKGSPEDFDKIPAKFSDAATSGLTYEVKSGDQTYDIELKD